MDTIYSEIQIIWESIWEKWSWFCTHWLSVFEEKWSNFRI